MNRDKQTSASLLRALYSMLWALTLSMLSTASTAETLNAAVDRQQLSENETLTLRVRLAGSSNPSGKPDFSSLLQNFDILSANPSSQYKNINGRVEQYTDWNLTLVPKTVGKLLIPPITFNKLSTRPITINVKKETHTAGHTKPIRLETHINTTDAYVQEQVILSYRLFYSTYASNLKMEDINLENVQIEELPRSDYKKTIGSTTYDVAEFNYALTPEASGTYTIPSFLWSLNTSDQPNNRRFGFSANRMKLHRLRTDELTLTVKPRPQNYPANATWLPASALTIQEQWQGSPDDFRVGEPLTRKIIIEANGLSGEQLPKIVNSRGNSDFKFYADKPTINSKTHAQGVAGQRIENIAIVANRAGDLTLPKVEITWWDTNKDELRTSTLPERTITVKPSDTNIASQGNQQDDIASSSVLSEDMPRRSTPTDTRIQSQIPLGWGIALLALIISNAILAMLWFMQKKTIAAMKQNKRMQSPIEDPNEKQAYSQLRYATENDEPEVIRDALLRWMRTRWPHQHNSLDKLASVIDDSRLSTALRVLDNSLFSAQPSNPGDLKDIMITLDAWRGFNHKANKQQKSALKPLYGT